jgi:dihydrofolate reductase
MDKIKVSAFSISIDGFGAGINQDLKNPLGIRGMELHNWIFATKTFQKMIGNMGGEDGVDNTIFEKGFENVGCWIMGRNMFGPIRGNWINEEWKGWWGEEPPFHAPVFVVTHHKREPLMMKGGTTFYFVTDGIHQALEEAKKAANKKEIRISGGVSTIRQFLKAGYIDEMHLAVSPVFLGAGENLFTNINISALGFNKIEKIEGENATHFILTSEG